MDLGRCLTIPPAPLALDAGVTGTGSQVRELRVGYLRDGKFVAPDIQLPSGEIVPGRSLVNQRSTCPEAHETVPEDVQVRTERLTIPVLGDGFIESVSDDVILARRDLQCQASGGRICGLAVAVPILEAPGQTGIGRFGWKAQHRSLLSFAADAYVNEMGITNPLQPTETAQGHLQHHGWPPQRRRHRYVRAVHAGDESTRP